MTTLTLAAPHRFTVAEYYGMAEAGLLAPDAHVELLEGQILDMFPIGPFHSGTVNYLANLFARRGGERWIVHSQNPVRLGERSEPQPDVALLRPRADSYRTSHPTPDDVFLLVEVADSSLRFDREEKLPLYARAGIPEFWLVNLVDRVLEVYRDPFPETGVYRQTARLSEGVQAAPAAFPDVTLSVAELLF